MNKTNINNVDLLFLECLSKNIDSNNLSPDYVLLNSTLSKKNYYDTNTRLLTLFLKLTEFNTNFNVYNSFISFIVKKIVYNFKTSKDVISDFPNTLLNKTMIKYLIDNKYFFKYENAHKSMFDIIIQSTDNIKYFNFSLEEEYIPYYLVVTRKYNETLNSYLNAFNLSLIEPSRLKIYSNYLNLVFNLLKNNINNDNRNELLNSNYTLYFQIIDTNIELYKYFKLLKENTNFVKITDNTNEIIEKDLDEIKNTLYICLNNTDFNYEFVNAINNYYYYNTSYKYHDFLLSIIPFLITNTITFENSQIFNSIYNNICSNLIKIFSDENIIIYHKIKFINEYNWEIFNSKEKIELLLIFYKELERFDESTGFTEKTATRNNIIKILNKVNFISNYLDNSNESVIKDFFILYISELNKLYTTICDEKVKLTKYNIYKNNNKLLRCKSTISILINNLEYYYDIFYKIIKTNKIYNEDYNVLIKNIINLVVNWIEKSNRTRIYIICYFCKNVDDYDLIYETIKEKIQNILINFFDNINDLIENNIITEFFKENNYYYNEDAWLLTKELIGPLSINNNNLNVYRIISKLITNINKNNIEYDINEIPNEFLDPIMMVPIKIPYEIPETKSIVDKDLILDYLTYDEINPFTRTKLTKEELNEYNNKEDVKDRCNKFIKDFNNWKKNNKK
jgi:hypothetical protein